MARKNYSDEFRRRAVDLYESTAGATARGIADDLGIERGTLRHWLDRYGTGEKTAADGTLTRDAPVAGSENASRQETFPFRSAERSVSCRRPKPCRRPGKAEPAAKP